jgi:hypothetical protein
MRSFANWGIPGEKTGRLSDQGQDPPGDGQPNQPAADTSKIFQKFFWTPLELFSVLPIFLGVAEMRPGRLMGPEH